MVCTVAAVALPGAIYKMDCWACSRAVVNLLQHVGPVVEVVASPGSNHNAGCQHEHADHSHVQRRLCIVISPVSVSMASNACTVTATQ
jgi:hypothetical protein